MKSDVESREAFGVRRRTPHGVRGLKLEPDALLNKLKESHPARGAWIEMSLAGDDAKMSR